MKHLRIGINPFLIVIIAVCCCLTSGCDSSDDQDSVFKGEYASDVVMGDSVLPEQGRIYRDPLYYREIDGQKYIAVNLPSASLYSIDDIESLSVGDDLSIDRDLTVHIDRLDYDPEWEPADSSEEGLADVDGSINYRKKGRLIVNDYFYFAHPLRKVGSDGSVVDCDGDLSSDKWVLGYLAASSDNDSANFYYRFDNCVWVKVKDDCKVRFVTSDGLTPSMNITEILNMMDRYAGQRGQYAPYEQPEHFALASLEYRIGEDAISRITVG